MKKYKCQLSRSSGCEARIKEIEIEKETERSVWIDGIDTHAEG